MVKITKIKKNRWKEYKELRLESLKKDPLAFGSTYKDEINLDQRQWKERMKDTLFAIDGDNLIGMIVYKFENREKTSHIAWIFGLYVTKEHRRKGMGKKLLGNAIQTINKNPKIEKIKIIADPIQKEAIKLYKKLGFKIVAELKKEIKYKQKYYNEIYLEKYL